MASSDLIWQLTRSQNAYLVKRRQAGGLQVSTDPLNPTGKNSFSQSGLANEKAIGVVKCGKNIKLVTKSAKNANKPAKAFVVTSFKQHSSGRKVAGAVSKAAAGYREDLRQAAILKASALVRAEKPKKAQPAKAQR
ncbi:hypothetical protein TRVA0_014S00144 [Trichomonascus vanleenenianus]|uniref:uncharacterized protein n=1 Tax=Trichomonascus vanleenenianus TaxID=2268995 RepID=UPI003EC9C948